MVCMGCMGCIIIIIIAIVTTIIVTTIIVTDDYDDYDDDDDGPWVIQLPTRVFHHFTSMWMRGRGDQLLAQGNVAVFVCRCFIYLGSMCLGHVRLWRSDYS